MWGFHLPCRSLGATEAVAVTQVDVVVWVMKGLRSAHWETLEELGGETKASLSQGAGMLTFC